VCQPSSIEPSPAFSAANGIGDVLPDSKTIPVILESIVSAEFIDDEIEAAHEALATGGPGRGCEGDGRARRQAASRVDRRPCFPPTWRLDG